MSQRQDGDPMHNIIVKLRVSLWTVGVYHDVNSWLKVIAEYGNYESTACLIIRILDIFSLGGFLLW